MDKKPLHPFHVEALDYYCRYVLQPLFEDSMGSGMHPEHPIAREEVLYRISPKSFELFYLGYQNFKRGLQSTVTEYIPHPDIGISQEKVKGLRENFHKLNPFL